MTAPAAEPLAEPVRDRPVLTVSLAAVAENWRTLKDAAPRAETAAVVKADGYGLGAAPIAAKLRAAGCATIFIATIDEGRALRAGSDSGRRSAALHVDTGMSRAGLSPAELDTLVAEPALLAKLDLALVMSHLACGDEADHPQNRLQLGRFRAALARLPAAPASLAASGGVFLGPDYHFDLVRPGIALYGGHPMLAGANPMRAAATLTAEVIGVRTLQRGDTAGYGATYAATHEVRLAVCNIGYADGIMRSLSNRGVAYIGDVACPYAGRVSMDLLTLDVTAVPPALAARGAQVEIIGPRMPIEEMAARAGTANYEILTGLGNRFTRVMLDSQWTRVV